MTTNRTSAAGDPVDGGRPVRVYTEAQWKLLQSANHTIVQTFDITAYKASRVITWPNQDIDFTPGTGTFRGAGQYIRKTSAEQVTSSTTPQQDDVFQFTLAANTEYQLDGTIACTPASATPGLKTRFDWPAGATGIITLTGGSGTNARVFKHTASAASYGLAVPAAGIILDVSGTIKTGVTTGTLDFLWAQNVSSVDYTQIDAGCIMTLYPKA